MHACHLALGDQKKVVRDRWAINPSCGVPHAAWQQTFAFAYKVREMNHAFRAFREAGDKGHDLIQQHVPQKWTPRRALSTTLDSQSAHSPIQWGTKGWPVMGFFAANTGAGTLLSQ